MAYISRECVSCTDPTKRCESTYHGKDEKGKVFRGNMYVCSNAHCQINIERMRTQRRLRQCEDEPRR